MIKLSIQNDKGGCGKSSTAINLAFGLSRKGYRVLLVDNDPQANTTNNVLKASKSLDEKEMNEIIKTFNELSKDENSNELFSAKEALHQYVEKKIFDCSIVDVYKNPSVVKKAIVKSEYDNLWVLPSTHELSELDFYLKGEQFNRDGRLRDALDFVKEDYDVVIIDNSPFTNALTFNSISGCYDEGDQIIIPISIDQFGIEGLDYTMKTLLSWLSYAPYPLRYDLKVVITMTKRTKISKSGIEMMKHIFKDRVFQSTLRFQDKPMSSAFLNKRILLDAFPNSGIAQDYQKLVDEVEEKLIKNNK